MICYFTNDIHCNEHVYANALLKPFQFFWRSFNFITADFDIILNDISYPQEFVDSPSEFDYLSNLF